MRQHLLAEAHGPDGYVFHCDACHFEAEYPNKQLLHKCPQCGRKLLGGKPLANRKTRRRHEASRTRKERERELGFKRDALPRVGVLRKTRAERNAEKRERRRR